jgi:hypothetical protein
MNAPPHHRGWSPGAQSKVDDASDEDIKATSGGFDVKSKA